MNQTVYFSLFKRTTIKKFLEQSTVIFDKARRRTATTEELMHIVSNNTDIYEPVLKKDALKPITESNFLALYFLLINIYYCF